MVSTLFQVLAWLTLVLGVLAAVLLVVVAGIGAGQTELAGIGRQLPFGLYVRALSMSGVRSLIAALVLGLGSVVQFLLLLAASDLIRLLIDIEDNTHVTHEAMPPIP
jgi:hypothetical protein